MGMFRTSGRAIGLGALLLPAIAMSPVAAAPLSGAGFAASQDVPRNAETVQYRRWGYGMYSGPGVGYYADDKYRPSYRVYDYRYYPAYRTYDYRDRRDFRKHSRRWVKERFEHPLGRQ